MKTGCAVAALLVASALPLPGRAAETIRWQHPWAADVALRYATESIDDRTRDGQRTRMRATDTTEIRIAEARADGFLQAWTSQDARMELLEGDSAALAPAQAAVDAMAGMALEVELDRDANFHGIRNVEAIGARLRPALRPVVETGIDAGLDTLGPGQRAEARAQAAARVEAALAHMTSPPMLQAMLGRVPQAYNGFFGAELEAGQWYALETELDNPLGGPKFPARLEVAFTVSEDDPDDVFLEWTQAIDPVAGAGAAWALVERLTGQALDPALRKGLPDALDLRDEGMMLFRRGSGVIEMFEATRTVRLGASQQVQRQRMRLIGGDHDHAWTDEAEAPVATGGQQG